MGFHIYPSLPIAQKTILVKKMARAFAACWDVPLPTPRTIVELCVTTQQPTTGAGGGGGGITLHVGPDLHHSLGGPFSSVRAYLVAYIRQAYVALTKQQAIDAYKAQYTAAIGAFLAPKLDSCIPRIVDDVPVVLVHADMGPHNLILAESDPTAVQAVIDWELVGSAPVATQFALLETVFPPAGAEPLGSTVRRRGRTERRRARCAAPGVLGRDSGMEGRVGGGTRRAGFWSGSSLGCI